MAGSIEDIAGRLGPVLASTGLMIRGAFHPTAEDGVPTCLDGRPAGTVLLLGNAGPDLWQAFSSDRDRGVEPTRGSHPLDRWVMGHVRRAATALGATAVDPMRPPHVPIQRWARRAGGVFPSPLGLLIHPRFGLWHVYRGALLLPDRVDFPDPEGEESPCDSCTTRPCLRACPVEAFRPDGFRMDLCADHVEGDRGGACRRLGCLARRACPVGREFRYPDDACAYHMQAVVSTVRHMQEAAT